jgi:hypothetical protein
VRRKWDAGHGNDAPLSCGSSFRAVPIPTRMASCKVLILFPKRTSFKTADNRGPPHQWVIPMLSFPLRINCWPPLPAILASRDWANVRVTYGRVVSRAPELKTADRKSGGADWSVILVWSQLRRRLHKDSSRLFVEVVLQRRCFPHHIFHSP